MSVTFADGFYQQPNFYGGYPRGGGRGGFGNSGMYYGGRGGGNSWRERGDNRGPPTRGSSYGKNGLSVVHFGILNSICTHSSFQFYTISVP